MAHSAMDPVGVDIAASASNSPEARKAANKALRRASRAQQSASRRIQDDAELSADVEEIEAPEALRALEGNSQEEAHEDRLEKGLYSESGPARPDDDAHIDLQA